MARRDSFFLDKMWVSAQRPPSGYLLWVDPNKRQIKVCTSADKSFNKGEPEPTFKVVASYGGGEGSGMAEEDINSLIETSTASLKTTLDTEHQAMVSTSINTLRSELESLITAQLTQQATSLKTELQQYATTAASTAATNVMTTIIGGAPTDGDTLKEVYDLVKTNAANISTNTTAIGTNTTNIGANTTALEEHIQSVADQLESHKEETKEAATEAAVTAVQQNIVGNAPEDMDTLEEIAAAISNLDGGGSGDSVESIPDAKLEELMNGLD